MQITEFHPFRTTQPQPGGIIFPKEISERIFDFFTEKEKNLVARIDNTSLCFVRKQLAEAKERRLDVQLKLVKCKKNIELFQSIPIYIFKIGKFGGVLSILAQIFTPPATPLLIGLGLASAGLTTVIANYMDSKTKDCSDFILGKYEEFARRIEVYMRIDPRQSYETVRCRVRTEMEKESGHLFPYLNL